MYVLQGFREEKGHFFKGKTMKKKLQSLSLAPKVSPWLSH